MLKLPKRDLPQITFRRDLPEWMAGGAPCFIEFDARAGGVVNIAYQAAQEQVWIKAKIAERKLGKIDDDAAYVESNFANMTEIARERLLAMYDTCIIAWRANILDDGAPITPTREKFAELLDLRVPEVAKAIRDLEAEVLAAGVAVKDETDAIVKN